MTFLSRQPWVGNEESSTPWLQLAGTDWLLGHQVSQTASLVSHLAKPANAMEHGAVEYRIVRPLPTNSVERQDEAHRALARLAVSAESIRHQAVLSLVASELDQPPFALVLPWVTARPLPAWRAREMELSLSRMLWIARQIAEVVAVCRERSRVHTRLVPPHILVCPRDRVSVVGWSRSRWQGDLWTDEDLQDESFPWFLAPEMSIPGHSLTGCEDVFALGAILHYLVSGRLGFSANELDGPSGNLQWLPHLCAVEPLCPGELATLVESMLSPTPCLRPPMHHVLDALLGLEIDHLGDERLMGVTPR
ncbi:MAG TPA: protein kinase [Pirellulaceae bacterium]|nr:protein kinase [Pirellulaceae bacterium]